MIRISKPAGTTRIMTTGLMDSWNRALILRSQEWFNMNVSGVNLKICETDSQTAGLPGSWSELSWSGPSQTLATGQSTEALLDGLIEIDPDYLETDPHHLQVLLELSKERGQKPESLRLIRCKGSQVSPQLREFAEQTWGVPVIEIYFREETGIMAIQCPDNQGLHVQSEFVHLEVLNGDNQPCRPGEVGRIVVTTLRNYQTPLIRYDTGDFAEVGEPCSCGRTLPALTRILE
jgi:phenylacetate-CoA ligase